MARVLRPFSAEALELLDHVPVFDLVLFVAGNHDEHAVAEGIDVEVCNGAAKLQILRCEGCLIPL